MNETAGTLLGLCRQLLTPNAQAIAFQKGRNGAPMLRAATATGAVIVKVHRTSREHRREVRAYRYWTSTLGDRAPRFLAESDDPLAIIITALPGEGFVEARLEVGAEMSVYRQAGELLSRLHRAAPPRTNPDGCRRLVEQGERRLVSASRLLPERRLTQVREHLAALVKLGPIPAVPCHLDYQPRNMIVGLDGKLGIIGYERAGYDLAGRDLVALATSVWPLRPDLEAAFLAGYGPLSSLDRQVIAHCAYLEKLDAVLDQLP